MTYLQQAPHGQGWVGSFGQDHGPYKVWHEAPPFGQCSCRNLLFTCKNLALVICPFRFGRNIFLSFFLFWTVLGHGYRVYSALYCAARSDRNLLFRIPLVTLGEFWLVVSRTVVLPGYIFPRVTFTFSPLVSFHRDRFLRFPKLLRPCAFRSHSSLFRHTELSPLSLLLGLSPRLANLLALGRQAKTLGASPTTELATWVSHWSKMPTWSGWPLPG